MPKIKTVRVAERSDDEKLRQCMRAIPMEGRIRLVFEREPSFFDSLDVHGETTVVAGEGDGEILGFGLRSVDRHYIEGSEQRVGYLGNLRMRPDSRDVRGLRLGWKLFAEIHENDPVDLYFTTIQESNELARKVLESGRFKIPPYHQVSTINSFVFSPRSPRKVRVAETLRGDAVGAGEIARFMEREGARRNFFPVFEAGDFGSPRMRGLELRDVHVAVDGSTILGMLAPWKQTSFKQVRVTGYPLGMRLTKPLVNTLGYLLRRPYIPSAGQILEMTYAALPLVAGDRVDIFAQLLGEACAALRPTEHMVIGLTDDDPLLAAMTFPTHRERFCLYTVSPDGKTPTLTRTPYIEGAVL